MCRDGGERSNRIIWNPPAMSTETSRHCRKRLLPPPPHLSCYLLPTRQSSAPCTLPRSCRWCCAGLHLYRRCKAAAYQHHSSCRGRSSSAESSVPLNQCQSRSLHGNQPLFVKVEECILMTETLEQNFQTAAVSIKGGSRGDTANEKDATWVTSPTAI